MSNKTYIAKLVNFVIYSCDYNALNMMIKVSSTIKIRRFRFDIKSNHVWKLNRQLIGKKANVKKIVMKNINLTTKQKNVTIF